MGLYTYTTKDEIEYIKFLGTHRRNVDGLRVELDDISPVDKASLLIGYARTIANRKNWGLINKGEVESYVIACVRRLNANLAREMEALMSKMPPM